MSWVMQDHFSTLCLAGFYYLEHWGHHQLAVYSPGSLFSKKIRPAFLLQNGVAWTNQIKFVNRAAFSSYSRITYWTILDTVRQSSISYVMIWQRRYKTHLSSAICSPYHCRLISPTIPTTNCQHKCMNVYYASY